jgi:signal transduction histidine kinase
MSLCNSPGWFIANLSVNGLITSVISASEPLTGYAPQDLIGRPVTHILADPSVFEVPKIFEIAKENGFWRGSLIHHFPSADNIESQSIVTRVAGRDSINTSYLLLSDLAATSENGSSGDPGMADIAIDLRAFAHDLNNPLAVTMGFTQLLILNANCQGNIRADIEKLYIELQRVGNVVEQLHQYAISLYEKSYAGRAPAKKATRRA